MKHGMNAATIQQALHNLSGDDLIPFKQIIKYWLPSIADRDITTNLDQLINTVAHRIENASKHDTTNTIAIHTYQEIAETFDEYYEDAQASMTPGMSPHHLPSLPQQRTMSRDAVVYESPSPPHAAAPRLPPLSALQRPQSSAYTPSQSPAYPGQSPASQGQFQYPSPPSSAHASSAHASPALSRRASRLMRSPYGGITPPRPRLRDVVTKLLGSPRKNAVLSEIDEVTLRENFPPEILLHSTDEHIRVVAQIALNVFRKIKILDRFTSRITQKSGAFAGKRVTLSGTGGYDTETSAMKRGYTTVTKTLEHALHNGFFIEEAQILAVGMFLHGSDIFYIATKHYRGRLPAVPQPTVTREARPDLWEIYEQSNLQLEIAGPMRQVHEEAFKMIVENAEKVGAERSFAPRIRAIGLDMFEYVPFCKRGPFGAQMMANVIEENEMWTGEFRELASLCTGTHISGCFSAFKATADYSDEYGLISLCCMATYNYTKLSPFPHETEWVAPPGGQFKTIVFRRRTGEDIQNFMRRVLFLLHKNVEIALRENILYCGLANVLEQIRENPTDIAFNNLRYYVFMWPKDIDIHLTSEYTIHEPTMHAIAYRT